MPFELREGKQQTQVCLVDLHFRHIIRELAQLVNEPNRRFFHGCWILLLECVVSLGHGLLEIAARPERLDVVVCHLVVEVA